MLKTQYLQKALTGAGIRRWVNRISTIVRRDEIEFDAIAVRGTSGLLVGPAVAAALDKDIIVCRKHGSSRHSSFDVEGPVGVINYIIVDDIICSGETVETIVGDVRRELSSAARCVAIFLYAEVENFSGLHHTSDKAPEYGLITREEYDNNVYGQ